MKPFTLCLLLITAASCAEEPPATSTNPASTPVAAATSPDPANGRTLISDYGCTSCHVVPGVEGPRATLAPSLEGIARRETISEGSVQNTPGNLTKFIQNPASLNPETSMPPSGLSDAQARDVVAYLWTL